MISKSRLLMTAFAVPLLLAAPAVRAFDITAASSVVLKASGDSDTHNETSAALTIDGSPSQSGVSDTANGQHAVILIDRDESLDLDGAITVRDYNGDTAHTLEDAVGLQIASAVTAASGIRLRNDAAISIIEVRGIEYDGDDDGYSDDYDSDEDGILEATAIGTFNRIGLWVQNEITATLIGESGSSILVEGNASSAGSTFTAGVRINGDGRLLDSLDLSTGISMYGDEARGVWLEGYTVDSDHVVEGYVRQRGDIDVRGEDGIGIDIDDTVGGALMIEALVNATGYATAPTPARGPDESDLTAAQQTANQNERRRGGSAVDVGAAVEGGIIVGGAVNRISTRSEEREFTCKADDGDCSADGINAVRAASSSVVSLKTDPYHYDENRRSGRITTYGEAAGEASLKITSVIGVASGASAEVVLDTTNDDFDSSTDAYDNTKTFYYSHGLLNRGTIAANSWYDAISLGSYQIDTKATAVLLNHAGATIHGGIYNSGSISATAYNSDAIAIDIADVTLTEGLRDGADGDDELFLNEGSISAVVATHVRSNDAVTKSSESAIAVRLGAETAVTLTAGTPKFVNSGSVSARSTHTQLDADTPATDDYETVAGDNAVAFDFSAYDDPVWLTQRMLRPSSTVAANVDGVSGNETVYTTGGDLDIDRAGDEDADGNVIGDGKIDTRDVGAPSIVGDVKFGDDGDYFIIEAGTVTGQIDFGAGDEQLQLENSMADDPDDDYEAPYTEFRGTIKNTGNLNLTLAANSDVADEKVRLHLDGQEKVNGGTSLSLTYLTLGEQSDLRFTINPEDITGNTAILDTAGLSMSASATISPFLTTLISASAPPVRLVESSSDLSGFSSGIADRLPEDGHPFIYNVALSIDESGSQDAIVAEFAVKSAADLGLNKTEAAALPAVLSHFRSNRNLETAITGITDGDDFASYYGQLLPQYGDGTMKQLAALAQSATGAVAQHLQIVSAGGRRGGDGWAQQFGDYRKQDGTAEADTVSGTSYGLALGYDAPAGLVDALGMYAQMSFTSVNEKPVPLSGSAPARDEMKAESFNFGAYLSDRLGPVSYELNAATGSVNFDSTRRVNFNGVADILTGAWDGTSTTAAARLAWPVLQDDHLLRVEAGVDHFKLEQDGFSESTSLITDPGLRLQLGSGSSDVTSRFIGLRGRLSRGGGHPAAVVFEPNYYIGFRSTADYSPYSARANFVGDSTQFDLTAPDEMQDSTEIGLGIAAHNDYFAFEFTYRGSFADDAETHGGGVSIRLLF